MNTHFLREVDNFLPFPSQPRLARHLGLAPRGRWERGGLRFTLKVELGDFRLLLLYNPKRDSLTDATMLIQKRKRDTWKIRIHFKEHNLMGQGGVWSHTCINCPSRIFCERNDLSQCFFGRLSENNPLGALGSPYPEEKDLACLALHPWYRKQ